MRKTLLAPTPIPLSSPVRPLLATCGGGGGGGMGGTMPRSSMGSRNSQPQPEAYVVPWKTLKAEDKPLTTPLVVMWFPAEAVEVDSSELNVSRTLVLYSAQFVGV